MGPYSPQSLKHFLSGPQQIRPAELNSLSSPPAPLTALTLHALLPWLLHTHMHTHYWSPHHTCNYQLTCSLSALDGLWYLCTHDTLSSATLDRVQGMLLPLCPASPLRSWRL